MQFALAILTQGLTVVCVLGVDELEEKGKTGCSHHYLHNATTANGKQASDMDPAGSVGAYKCTVKLWDWTMNPLSLLLFHKKHRHSS